MGKRFFLRDLGKNGIRPVFLNLKWKTTILIAFILIFSIVLVFYFIIKYENNLFNRQLEDTMNVYLETFKKDVEVLFIEKKDPTSLNKILKSYENIKNFLMAMLIDNSGNVIVHTPISSANRRILNSTLGDYKNVYENRVYFFEYEDVRKKRQWYNGFMPIYNPLIAGKNLKQLNEFIALFRNGKLLKADILDEESRNNFRFVKDIEEFYKSILESLKMPTQNKKRISEIRSGMAFIEKINKRFDRYKKGEALILSEKDFDNLMDKLKVLAFPEKKREEYLKIRKEKKKLFNNKVVYTEEEKNNIRFISFIENYLLSYYDTRGELNKNFDDLIKRLSYFDSKSAGKTEISQKEEKTLVIDRQYYVNMLNELKKDLNWLKKYLWGSFQFNSDRVEKVFSNFMNFYRIGTIRIVLDLNQLRIDQKKIINKVIDIVIMIILRVLVIAYLFAAFMISPLRKLSEGTDEVSRGNLDKVIQVSSRDEIGQLADKFNIMTKNLKKAFEEIKDKARMEQELINAKEIQEAILPKSFPKVKNYSFSAYYKPQTESGGDYYDFIDVDRDHFGFVIADVTGHGVGAGIVMAMLRSQLKTLGKGRTDTAQVLKELNPILIRDTLPTMFATVFYGVIDIRTDILYYSVAGHTPAILYNSQLDRLELLKTGGLPLGMMESSMFDANIEAHKRQLKKGDYLILYTDGITEAKSANKEEYGEDRFHKAIRKYCAGSLDTMRDRLISDLKSFVAGAEQSDDITLLLMKV